MITRMLAFVMDLRHALEIDDTVKSLAIRESFSHITQFIVWALNFIHFCAQFAIVSCPSDSTSAMKSLRKFKNYFKHKND